VSKQYVLQDSDGRTMCHISGHRADEEIRAGLSDRDPVHRSRIRRRPLAHSVKVRGLSARVGEHLADAVRRGQPWAVVALQEIRRADWTPEKYSHVD
jgi:hypothetical protein